MAGYERGTFLFLKGGTSPCFLLWEPDDHLGLQGMLVEMKKRNVYIYKEPVNHVQPLVAPAACAAEVSEDAKQFAFFCKQKRRLVWISCAMEGCVESPLFFTASS